MIFYMKNIFLGLTLVLIISGIGGCIDSNTNQSPSNISNTTISRDESLNESPTNVTSSSSKLLQIRNNLYFCRDV